MTNQEKVFAEGLIAKRNDNAPDFVICNLSVKVEEFKTFLDTYDNNGWVNLQVKKSQGGKIYAELDTWKPKEEDDSSGDEISVEEIPF